MTMASSGLRPVRRRMLLADDAYTLLREALLNNDIQPGRRLNIEQLSKELGVSITPIRHALVRLEADGLVAREPFKGYIASPLLDRDTVRDIYLARIIIETEVTSRAASVVTEEQLGDLRSLAEADPLAPYVGEDEDGEDSGVSCDEMLHRSIARIGGNTTLDGLVGTLNERLRAYRAFHLRRHNLTRWDPKTKKSTTQQEHLAIIDALRDGDADKAREAMRTHLTNASQRDIDSDPELPDPEN